MKLPPGLQRPTFEITGKGSGLPLRWIIYGTEGVGKTSLAAQAPKPIFAMTRGETGLQTLIDQRRLPEVAHFSDEFTRWEDVLSAVEWLISEDHPYETFIVDALDGVEELCKEYVRRTQCDGLEDKFEAYQRGYNMMLTPLRKLLNTFDELRSRRRMRIIMLSHSKVETTPNPAGLDYKRFTANIHAKLWPLVRAWADMVLFYDFFIKVSKDAKATGGQMRLLYPEHSATFDAKNRSGLSAEIDGGTSAQEAWANIMAALKAAYNNGKEG